MPAAIISHQMRYAGPSRNGACRETGLLSRARHARSEEPSLDALLSCGSTDRGVGSQSTGFMAPRSRAPAVLSANRSLAMLHLCPLTAGSCDCSRAFGSTRPLAHAAPGRAARSERAIHNLLKRQAGTLWRVGSWAFKTQFQSAANHSSNPD